MRDPKERLLDILDAIAAIERHRGRDKAAFERDELLQVGSLRHLQIIGEAARAPPEDVRAPASEIPWSKIVGMRNVLVHGYFDIDTDIVWDAATCRPSSPVGTAIEDTGRTEPVILYRPGRRFVAEPREQIFGSRNRIIHECADVDHGIVWAIVQNEALSYPKSPFATAISPPCTSGGRGGRSPPSVLRLLTVECRCLQEGRIAWQSRGLWRSKPAWSLPASRLINRRWAEFPASAACGFPLRPSLRWSPMG